MKPARAVFAALCLLLALCGAVPGAEPMIAILHTNDVHGRFAASGEAIGHDTIAAIYRDTRQRIPATLLLDAGDAIQGTALVKWNKGEAAIEIMGAAGYDGMALGNHEFDYGWAPIPALLKRAEFPFFTQPVVSGGEKGFLAAAVYERGGRRIGVFGLTTPETKQSSGGGFGREFGSGDDLVAYADAMTLSLRNAGAEVVICLAHLGVDDQGFITSYDLRDATEGIDVIVDGHSHTPLAEIEQVAGKALVVSAGEHARALGLVEFACVDGRLRPSARSITRAEAAGYAPVPEVTAVIDRWAAETEARTSTVLVRNPVFLDADRGVVRTRESELGNLMADAIRAATGADVALINGGNLRAPLAAGNATVADIEAVLPYDTIVLTAEVPGGAIREALEMSVSRYPGEFGGFLQVSGLTFVFDPKQPAGKRVASAEIGGKPLDDDRVYSVSVCDWLASGGDGYEMLVEPYRKPSGAGAVPLIDVFVSHLKQKTGWKPAIEGRIVAAP